MKINLFKNDLPDNFNLEGDLAIDTETMGLNPHRDRLCLLQLSNGDGNVYLIHFLRDDYFAPNLKRLLADENKCKIFHFARFDMSFIKKYLQVDLQNTYCTKIASRLTRTYTSFHGLKDLCKELLGINLSKQQQSTYWGASELSDEQLEYAAKDVLYLHNIRKILDEMLIKNGRNKLAQQIFKFLPIRVDLDLQGWDDIDIFAHSM